MFQSWTSVPYVVHSLGNRMNRNRLPQNRQQISITQRRHEPGEHTLSTHLCPFSCTAHDVDSAGCVGSIRWQQSIIPFAQSLSQRVQLECAFRWQCTFSAWPFVIDIRIIRIRIEWTTVAMPMNLIKKSNDKIPIFHNILWLLTNLRWPQIERCPQLDANLCHQQMLWAPLKWRTNRFATLLTIAFFDFLDNDFTIFTAQTKNRSPQSAHLHSHRSSVNIWNDFLNKMSFTRTICTVHTKPKVNHKK